MLLFALPSAISFDLSTSSGLRTIIKDVSSMLACSTSHPGNPSGNIFCKLASFIMGCVCHKNHLTVLMQIQVERIDCLIEKTGIFKVPAQNQNLSCSMSNHVF